MMTVSIRSMITLPLLAVAALPWAMSCGDLSGELEITVPPALPPTVRNIGFDPNLRRGELTTLSQSVFAPAGISGEENAITLTWIPPLGESVQVEFTATEANCEVGSLECNSSFRPQVPIELPVVNTTYDVIYTVQDQQGLSTDFLRQVFVGS